MLTVTLSGQPATFTTTDGWRSHCALTEKYLRAHVAGDTESAALAAVQAEYGDRCVVVSAEPAPPEPEASSAKPTKKGAGAQGTDAAP